MSPNGVVPSGTKRNASSAKATVPAPTAAAATAQAKAATSAKGAAAKGATASTPRSSASAKAGTSQLPGGGLLARSGAAKGAGSRAMSTVARTTQPTAAETAIAARKAASMTLPKNALEARISGFSSGIDMRRPLKLAGGNTGAAALAMGHKPAIVR